MAGGAAGACGRCNGRRRMWGRGAGRLQAAETPGPTDARRVRFRNALQRPTASPQRTDDPAGPAGARQPVPCSGRVSSRWGASLRAARSQQTARHLCTMPVVQRERALRPPQRADSATADGALSGRVPQRSAPRSPHTTAIEQQLRPRALVSSSHICCWATGLLCSLPSSPQQQVWSWGVSRAIEAACRRFAACQVSPPPPLPLPAGLPRRAATAVPKPAAACPAPSSTFAWGAPAASCAYNRRPSPGAAVRAMASGAAAGGAGTLQIERVPCLSDNYSWLLHEAQSGATAVVDPAEVEPVLAALQARGWKLTHILNSEKERPGAGPVLAEPCSAHAPA